MSKLGNIRNIDNFMNSLWPWDLFNECFTRGIRFSDIDGIVERNSRFLIVEGKQKGASIPKGQRIMLENLVRTGYFFVLILWGEPGEPRKYQVFGPSVNLPKQDCDLDIIKNFIKGWYKWANSYNHRLPDKLSPTVKLISELSDQELCILETHIEAEKISREIS